MSAIRVLSSISLLSALPVNLGCSNDRETAQTDGETAGPPIRQDMGRAVPDGRVSDAADRRDADTRRDLGTIGPTDALVVGPADLAQAADAQRPPDLGTPDAVFVETDPLRRAYLPVAQRFCDELFECSQNYGTPPGVYIWWEVAGCCNGGALRRYECVPYVLDTLQGFARGCQDVPDDSLCYCTSQRDCLHWMQTVECVVPDELIVWPLECRPGRRRNIADNLEECCGDDFAPCDPDRPRVGPIDGFFPPPAPTDAGPRLPPPADAGTPPAPPADAGTPQ